MNQLIIQQIIDKMDDFLIGKKIGEKDDNQTDNKKLAYDLFDPFDGLQKQE